jgi:hypothetical protein
MNGGATRRVAASILVFVRTIANPGSKFYAISASSSHTEIGWYRNRIVSVSRDIPLGAVPATERRFPYCPRSIW